MERLDICLESINLVIDQFNDALQDRTSTNQSEEQTRILFYSRVSLKSSSYAYSRLPLNGKR